MRTNQLLRPVFSITILLLFSNFGFAQSSIYHDAKELAKYLEEDYSIYVELQRAESSNATLTIKNDEKELSPKTDNRYVLSDYGYYYINVKGYEKSNSDSVIISTNDYIIEKIAANYELLFINSPNDKLIALSEQIEKNKRTEESVSEEESISYFLNPLTGTTTRVDTFYSLSSLDKTGFVEDEQERKNAYLLNLIHLGAHAKFKDVDKSSKFSFQKILNSYSNNPFLNNSTIESPIFSPNPDFFIWVRPEESLHDLFSTQYYKNYPWHKLLYGDSLLQLQKTVSFKDASSSYRKRIVTSQKELTDASIRINQTGRSKNVLDAKTVAVGLSDFIAERAQEELNLTFFNRFKRNLENPSELTVLFPNTKNLLYQFEISNYKTLLSHAREAFTVDLENLGLNFPEILELKKYKKSLDNSSDVFNLALIYSITDLAYKEEPVENILIAGFQKLKNRKAELNKSINIQLADAFLGEQNADKENPSSSSSIPAVGNPQELQQLKSQVIKYIKTANLAQQQLDRDYTFLKDLYLQLRQDSETYRQIEYNGGKKFKELQEKINLFPTQAVESFEQNLGKSFIYNNRRVYEYSFLNFYKKTISANLDGKPFYGYLLENPKPEDYQLYFKNQPDAKHSIVAEGIENTRNLLNENLEEGLNEILDFLKQSSEYNRTILKKDMLKRNEAFQPQNRIFDLNNRTRLLEKTIEQEIAFWKTYTQLDSTDHHIAGLYFLKILIQNNYHIRLFKRMEDDINANLMSFDSIVAKNYPIFFGKNFEENIKYNFDFLDSIQVNLEDKTETLATVFGNVVLNDVNIQRKFLESKLYQDTLVTEQKMEDNINQEKLFLYKRYENRYKFKPDYDEIEAGEINMDVVGTSGRVEMKMDSLVYVHRNLSQQINDFQKQLGESTDEVDKNSIQVKIDQLQTLQSELDVQLKTKQENELKKLKEEEATYYANIKSKKDSIISKYHADLIALENSSTKTEYIADAYYLEDNPFYEKYLLKKDKVAIIEYGNLFFMDDIDRKLEESERTIDSLNAISNGIKSYLTFLENKYCKNLVAAQDNATNLAKGFEVAAHLLFAFRNYEDSTSTLFYEDSVYVKVTVNKLDSLTGYMNTFTSDSLRIVKKPVDGTSEKQTAARWVTRKEFDALRKNDLEWNIFLGLLYQRLNSIEGTPRFSPDGVALLATKFLSITHDMETYRTELRRKKAITPDLVTFKDYYPFIRSTVDLFNTVITTPSLKDTTYTISKNLGLQNIPQISNEALSLYENIYVKDYGNAILNAMELLKIISTKKLKKGERRKSQRAVNAVLTYGTFMANMIDAESSDQVKNILKSATLPPGSSRIKRETISSFTVNSYLGAAIGKDRLLNVPDNLDLAKDAFGASLSVPIGFTYSVSPNWIKNNSSISLHVPLLDLGAITAYRQNPKNTNYSIDNLPDFSWNNLFAPGAFVVYNFANSPFSLGVGGQYGPQLREITLDTGEAVNVNSWRFPMAFFTIDVPFFNLHTGARKIIVD